MKIVFLDAITIGSDIDLSDFETLGKVVKYGFTTPEETPERVADADIVITKPINGNPVSRPS